MEEVFLQELHAHPGDDLTRQALADWLQERGDPRGELLRLCLVLKEHKEATQRQAAEARLRELLSVGVRPCVPVRTNTIGMRFALIPAGAFTMGSPADEEGRWQGEDQHEVEIAEAFYLGIHTVTQEQYHRVMGDNPSYFAATGEGCDEVKGVDTSRFPVEMVSWEDAVAFCGKLSALPEEKRWGRAYHLPSEAEWEYACRGGPVASVAPFHFGYSLTSHQANFHGNHPHGTADRGPHLGRPTEVGSYVPNCLGLHDLHGNVWEWCNDWYEEGSSRVVRGGGWDSVGSGCRAAFRSWGRPSLRVIYLGFRLAQFRGKGAPNS
jgi:uncharacterized protein (TIGR02996 family)